MEGSAETVTYNEHMMIIYCNFLLQESNRTAVLRSVISVEPIVRGKFSNISTSL